MTRSSGDVLLILAQAASQRGLYRSMNVRSGDRGSAVTAVQRLLAVHGHPVDTDGTFGTSTAEAIGALQEELHLATDSVVGPDTWAALLSQA